MCVFLSLSFSLRSPLSESESIRSLKKKKEKRKKRKERKGKERKGKERKGKERKGKERKGKERNKEKAPSPSRTLLDISQKMSPAAGFSASSPWGVLCASWAGVFISFAGSGNFFFPISSSFSSASGTPCEANVGTRQEVPEASHVVLGFVSIFLGGGEDRLPFPSFPIDGSLVASPPAESPIPILGFVHSAVDYLRIALYFSECEIPSFPSGSFSRLRGPPSVPRASS